MSGPVGWSRSTISRGGGVWVLGAVLVWAPVEAQTGQPAQPRRPSRGLFGSERVNPTSRQSVDVVVSATSANDEPGLAAAVGTPEQLRPGNLYSALGGALAYSRGRSTPWLDVTAGSEMRYYPNARELTSMNHQADARVQIRFLKMVQLPLV